MLEMCQGTASVLNVSAHLDGLPSHVMETIWLSSVCCFLVAIKCDQARELFGQSLDALDSVSAPLTLVVLILMPTKAAVRLLSRHVQVSEKTFVQCPCPAGPLQVGSEHTPDMTEVLLAPIQHAITIAIQEAKLDRQCAR